MTETEEAELDIYRKMIETMRKRVSTLPDPDRGIIIRFCRDLSHCPCICGVHVSYTQVDPTHTPK